MHGAAAGGGGGSHNGSHNGSSQHTHSVRSALESEDDSDEGLLDISAASWQGRAAAARARVFAGANHLSKGTLAGLTMDLEPPSRHHARNNM